MDQSDNQTQAGEQTLAAVLTPWSGASTDAALTVVIEFSVMGVARFLSHAQLARMWERACVRAALPLAYSQGFNPHLHLSLPLPKSVGLATVADVLCVRLSAAPAGEVHEATRSLHVRLQRELTDGLVIRRVILVAGKAVLYPEWVTYRMPVDVTPEHQQRIQTVLAAASWPLERSKGERSRPKIIDVRPYIEDVTITSRGLDVLCKINATGSIRIDEIQKLLAVSDADLTDAVTRTAVRWRARERA